MPNKSKKDILREQCLAARKSLLPEEALKKSYLITRKILEHEYFREAKIVLTYLSFAGEVETSELNNQIIKANKTIAYPLCIDDAIMVAATVDSEKSLIIGKHGIAAPDKRVAKIVDPAKIDLVIVPCLAFCGSSRMRLGWGSGYYDRFLPSCTKAKTMVPAFEVQHLPDLASDEWDVQLDVIVTEEDIYSTTYAEC